MSVHEDDSIISTSVAPLDQTKSHSLHLSWRSGVVAGVTPTRSRLESWTTGRQSSTRATHSHATYVAHSLKRRANFRCARERPRGHTELARCTLAECKSPRDGRLETGRQTFNNSQARTLWRTPVALKSARGPLARLERAPEGVTLGCVEGVAGRRRAIDRRTGCHEMNKRHRRQPTTSTRIGTCEPCQQ